MSSGLPQAERDGHKIGYNLRSKCRQGKALPILRWLTSSSQASYHSFPCKARKAHSFRCSSSPQKITIGFSARLQAPSQRKAVATHRELQTGPTRRAAEQTRRIERNSPCRAVCRRRSVGRGFLSNLSKLISFSLPSYIYNILNIFIGHLQWHCVIIFAKNICHKESEELT